MVGVCGYAVADIAPSVARVARQGGKRRVQEERRMGGEGLKGVGNFMHLDDLISPLKVSPPPSPLSSPVCMYEFDPTIATTVTIRGQNTSVYGLINTYIIYHNYRARAVYYVYGFDLTSLTFLFYIICI